MQLSGLNRSHKPTESENDQNHPAKMIKLLPKRWKTRAAGDQSPVQIENRSARKGAGSIGGGVSFIKAANSNADPGASTDQYDDAQN